MVGLEGFWPGCALVLGAWEAAALLSGRRVPMVSTTVRRSYCRQPKLTRAVTVLWLVGLGRHLLAEES